MPVSRPRARLSTARSSGSAEQVVAQRLGDELVDLVADCARHAAHDGAGRLFRRRTAGGERQRIEEGRDQAQLLIVRRGAEGRRRQD